MISHQVATHRQDKLAFAFSQQSKVGRLVLELGMYKKKGTLGARHHWDSMRSRQTFLEAYIKSNQACESIARCPALDENLSDLI